MGPLEKKRVFMGKKKKKITHGGVPGKKNLGVFSPKHLKGIFL